MFLQCTAPSSFHAEVVVMMKHQFFMKKAIFLFVFLFFALTIDVSAQSTKNAITFNEQLKKADNGDAHSQYIVGYAYFSGKNVPKDYSLAFKYYALSAAQEHPSGLTALALCYENGMGTTKDMAKAISLYKQAIDKGSAVAMCNLARLYERGQFIAQNNPKAFELYMQSADKGNTRGMYNTARCLQDGIGIAADASAAFEWNMKAARKNYAISMAEVGMAFYYGKGTYVDHAEALAWMEKAKTGGFDFVKNTEARKVYAALKSGDNSLTLAKTADGDNTSEVDEDADDKAAAVPSDEIDRNIPSTGMLNANTFVVIIGNENYRKVPVVDYAHNDATTFAAYCKTTFGVPEKNIKTYLDATFTDMMTALDDIKTISSLFNNNISLIFYYAGHGVPDEKTKGAYLLPVDVDGTKTQYCLSTEVLYSRLNELGTKRTIVIMDACFSGSQRGEGMLRAARGIAIKPKNTTPQGNMVVMSAATGDQTAYPLKQHGHGLFTYYLLKGIQETAGDITLGSLFDYVKKNVATVSVEQNKKQQTPTTQVSPEIVAKWEKWTLK